MWRFKQFMPKEPAALENRTIDVGNLKVHVRNIIAEGGFSSVYIARDAVNPSKQYALKQMICNDEESLELAKKEISVMKLLKGHPNVVTLQAHTIIDMGRMKEALLVMDFCEKSLVTVLENRGAGYFEEKQILLIFRDVCNAVFAMHVHSPPIAHSTQPYLVKQAQLEPVTSRSHSDNFYHCTKAPSTPVGFHEPSLECNLRDLKAENVLLGPDGAWKLCDFGSSSTNHKRFERPEEMGIEEDNIRKHTTPAYRAPEMWDLFRKEVISEKVDIWALGCLLYRICYFKSAFDGESKLQILNGNYRIPDQPRYSSSILELIKDMLQASPDTRPDITQARALLDWPFISMILDLWKETPDGLASTGLADMQLPNTTVNDEAPAKRAPRRAPPPPPSGAQVADSMSSSVSFKEHQHSRPSLGNESGNGAPLGAFWSTLHAKDARASEEKGPMFDVESSNESISKNNLRHPENHCHVDSASPPRAPLFRAGNQQAKKSFHLDSKRSGNDSSEDFEIRFFPEDGDRTIDKTKKSPASTAMFQNEAFNTFVAEFDSTKYHSGNNRSGKDDLEAELGRLKEQLKQANLEKSEITSKYEKLSAICRSQRQELQELKNALAARTPSPKKDPKTNASPENWQSVSQPRLKIEGSVWELQQGMLTSTSNSHALESKPWKAFSDEPASEQQPIQKSNHPRSVRTTNGHQNKQTTAATGSSFTTWGFDQDTFTASPASSRTGHASDQGSNSQRFGNQKTIESKQSTQPAGWAGF
ncbi:hypothetical protein ACLOJK_021207 [Asimina triloba]